MSIHLLSTGHCVGSRALGKTLLRYSRILCIIEEKERKEQPQYIVKTYTQDKPEVV